MVGQQLDVIVTDGEKLEDFELDIEVEKTQEMDEILIKFTTLGSMPDVAFVMTKEFNAILNSYSSVFELQLSCNGNRPVQAIVKKVVLSIEYIDFADVFSPMLVCKLPPHALYDHAYNRPIYKTKLIAVYGLYLQRQQNEEEKSTIRVSKTRYISLCAHANSI